MNETRDERVAAVRRNLLGARTKLDAWRVEDDGELGVTIIMVGVGTPRGVSARVWLEANGGIPEPEPAPEEG